MNLIYCLLHLTITMKNVGVFLVCVFLPFIVSWDVNLHVLLETGSNCTNCNRSVPLSDMRGSLNLSLHALRPGDLFAKAKAVRSIRGDIVVDSACSPCMTTYLDNPLVWSSQGGSCCSDSCFGETMYVDDVHIFQSVSKELMHNPHINDSFLNILSFILRREKITTYIVIMTSDDNGYTATVPVFSTNMTKTLSYIVDKNGNFSSDKKLKEIYNNIEEKDLNFVTICSTACLRNMINQVQRLEKEVSRSTVFKRSRWLLVPTEGRDVEVVLQSVFKNMPIVESADLSIVTFQSCQRQHSRLNLPEIADTLSMHKTDITKSNAVDATFRVVEGLISSAPPAVADVYTVYGTDKGQRLRLNGKVTSDESSVLSNELFDSDMYGYNNRTFIVGMLAWPPFVYKEEVNGKVKYTGLAVDLLEELAQRLNFSYVYRESDDKEWGRIKNGKWTGLVGEIGEGKLDLVATPLTISDAREAMMDFTQPYFYVHSMIILAKQDPNANKWFTLVAPFRYEVHICIFFSLILSSVYLFSVEEINPINTWTDNRLLARRMRYGDILWYHFGALMANGGAYLPTSVSGRSVLACWWIFTVIMAATYSGNLIAFLTVSSDDQPFSTLAGMIEQDDEYKWGLLGGSAIITLFEDSKRKDYQKIWEGIERDSVDDPDIQSLELDVHLHKVLTEKYAYIGDSTTWEVWQTKSCNLDVLQEQFYPMRYGIGLPNNSVHTKLFSDQLLRIQESGLVEVWHQRWRPAVRCEKNPKGAKRVDLLALQSAFYAAGVGVLLGGLILSTEYVYNKTCKGKIHLSLKCCRKKEQ